MLWHEVSIPRVQGAATAEGMRPMRLRIEEEVSVPDALRAPSDAIAARRSPISPCTCVRPGRHLPVPAGVADQMSNALLFVGSDGVMSISHVVLPADVGAVVQ